jgi:hypothetical protein
VTVARVGAGRGRGRDPPFPCPLDPTADRNRRPGGRGERERGKGETPTRPVLVEPDRDSTGTATRPARRRTGQRNYHDLRRGAGRVASRRGCRSGFSCSATMTAPRGRNRVAAGARRGAHRISSLRRTGRNRDRGRNRNGDCSCDRNRNRCRDRGRGRGRDRGRRRGGSRDRGRGDLWARRAARDRKPVQRIGAAYLTKKVQYPCPNALDAILGAVEAIFHCGYLTASARPWP